MKLTNKKFFLGFSLLACLMLGVVFGKSVISQFYPSVSYMESPSYMYVGGGVPVYAQHAVTVIIGDVQEVQPLYYKENSGVIAQQDVKIDVKEVLKGDINVKSLSLLVDGGQTVYGEPTEFGVSFKQGEKVLLFLGKDSSGNSFLYAGPNGKYLIDQNDNAISATGEKVSLADARAQISYAVKNPIKIISAPQVPYTGEVHPTQAGNNPMQ
jgi:hypothetical protein